MKTRSAKNKGRILQNYVRDTLYSSFPGLEEGDIRSQIMGVSGLDILLAGEAKKLFPFAVECKNHRTLSLPAALEQSKSNAGNLTPCVCHKPHGKGFNKTIISFYLEDFLEMWVKERQEK